MYAEHQPEIAKYAAETPENLYNVLLFVQTTIQQHFSRVPAILADIRNSGSSTCLSARQRDAIAFYYAKRQSIYDDLFNATDDVERMIVLTDLPGFGMVKAGFIMQLVFGTVGCIDTHNMKLYSIAASQLQLKGSLRSRLNKLRDYIELCEKLDTARLWDVWCDYVAAKYPMKFRSGEAVSALHVQCICV